MKKPPSASVSPPIHTTQRVPIVSSKPRSGCGSGGGGAAAAPAACSGVSDGAAGATDSDVGNDGRWCRCGRGRGRRQGLLERFKRRERRRHGRSGGRRRCLHRVQALAQLRHLVHGLAREDQGDDRDHEREENEGVVEHQASRRARQSVNRPRPQPGCNPVSAVLPAKSSNGPAPSARHSCPGRGAVRSAAPQSRDPRSQRMDPGSAAHHAASAARCAASGEHRVIPDRAGTAGLRPSCCRGPFRRARAASGPRAPAPCRRG